MYIDRVERKLTMNKTILVIGEVTRNQYQEARLELLRQGHQPKIVRTTMDNIKVDEYKLLGAYKGLEVEEVVMLDEKTEDQLLKESGTKHYEQFGDIGSIVVTDEVYSRHCSHGSLNAPWYVEGFFDKVPLWRVHNGNYVELIC